MSQSIFTTDFGAAVTRASRDFRRRERRAVAAAPVLVVEGVCKSYAAGARGCGAVVRVLDGASLRVGAGEIVGVAGGEGTGKSTLLLCAAGVVRAERGRVLWGAEDGCGGRSLSQPRYLDLRGGTAEREVRAAIESGARVVLLDHASAALLSELRAMLARSRLGAASASAIVVTSRSRAELVRVASRVLVLREGRLAAGESAARNGLHARVVPTTQRKRSAARASSAFPAAFARERMRST
ncbi:MAG TPA: ATP-binding cassette domain-containing protein [Gemmatimonadaceae bacterium]|nr:ATP-binding cassette domain-containing protein [Gemmatimonadaceae bacterium]